MSTKKKNVRLAAQVVKTSAAASEVVLPLELISTCQFKITSGTSLTWTGLRSTSAKPSEWPAFYVTTLPGNAAAGTPSSYDLRSIAAQARYFQIELTATDRDVVYFVTSPGGEPQRIPVSRGAVFVVPTRLSDQGVTKVDLTFDGECCTIRAVPKPLTKKAAGGQGTPVVLDDDDDDVPPPPMP